MVYTRNRRWKPVTMFAHARPAATPTRRGAAASRGDTLRRVLWIGFAGHTDSRDRYAW
jgi:hypothetical protein